MAELRKYVVGNDDAGNQLSAIDERDVEPLVEAARHIAAPQSASDTLKETATERVTRLVALRTALQPFDSKEDTPRSDDFFGTGEADGQDFKLAERCPTCQKPVNDGSRLQELLEWVEGEQAKSGGADEEERIAAGFALASVADQIRHLQGKGEEC